MRRALRTFVFVVGFFCVGAALVTPTIAIADQPPMPLEPPHPGR